MDVKKIAIGCDHAGYEYKAAIKTMLTKLGIELTDYGTDGPESVDYPDFAHPVATAVESGQTDLGVVICGSGNGVNMAVNKHEGIRGALCWNEDLAALARQHNNANVIAIPARFISEELAVKLVKIFVETDFEGGRHARRVGKIGCAV